MAFKYVFYAKTYLKLSVENDFPIEFILIKVFK